MPLCSVCRSFKLSNLIRPLGQVHRSISDLRVSARNCDLCSLFQVVVSKGKHDGKEEDLVLRIYGVRVPTTLAQDHRPLCLDHLDLRVVRKQDSSHLKFDILRLIHTSPRIPGFPESTGRLRIYADPESPGALSGDLLQHKIELPDRVDSIKRWQETCSSTHAECERRDLSDDDEQDGHPVLPTRVLDVGIAPNFEDLFLYETSGEKASYLALSHRWGGAKLLTTTSTNLSSHKKFIELADLCKTFQDAIMVTRKLGVRFLWNDSLCIIQNSASDWETESSRMGRIYSNATLTLSAACALSGDTGLFQSRETSGEVKVPFLTEDDSDIIPCFISDHSPRDFDQEVSQGPLGQRAWTLQERYLSTRIVHYGETQIHWECQEATWDEGSSLPLRLLSRFGIDGVGLHKSLRLSHWSVTHGFDAENKFIDGHGYNTWYGLVTEYSKRSLTFGSDKLPALSGLARLFARANHDEYLAGLWRKDLLVGLTWHKDQRCPSLRRPPPEGEAPRRAPSWSWASCDGEIKFGATEYESQPAIDTLSLCATVVHSGADFYGQIKSGSLSVTGIVKVCNPALTTDAAHDRGWVHTNGTMFDIDTGSSSADVRIGEIAFDSPDDPALLHTPTHALFLSAVVRGPEYRDFRPYAPQVLLRRPEWCYALSLKESDHDHRPGCFVRVGLARIDRAFFEGEAPREITIV